MTIAWCSGVPRPQPEEGDSALGLPVLDSLCLDVWFARIIFACIELL